MRSIHYAGALLITGLFFACSAESGRDPQPVKEDPADASVFVSSDVVKGRLRPARIPGTGEGSPISIGQTVSGRLETTDVENEYGEFEDHWDFDGSAGDVITATMRSTDFDSYLYLDFMGGSEREAIDEDDDSGGGLDSRIDVTLPLSGRYRLATAAWDLAQGNYSLTLERSDSGGGATPLPAGGVASGELTSADPALDDGRGFDAWLYEGSAGDELEITMTSSDFDTYLAIGAGSPSQFDYLDHNDDDATSTNSSLTAVLPDDGLYTILASSYEVGEQGSYDLTVRSSSPDWASLYPGGGDPNGRYAVLVGVGDYPGEDQDLAGTITDAEAMHDLLVGHYGFDPSNVVMLTDSEATREQISNAVLRHLGQAGPDGLAVFFYAGHGTQLEENVGLRPPIDDEADGRDEALYVWGYGERGGVLLDEELGFLVDRLEAGRKLVILDSCNSGTGVRAGGARIRAAATRDMPRAPFIPSRSSLLESNAAGNSRGVDGAELFSGSDDYLLLAAAADDEYAWESPVAAGEPSSGIFTTLLTEALRLADDQTTFADLMSSLRDEVVTVTRDEFGDVQTPQVEGGLAGARVNEFMNDR